MLRMTEEEYLDFLRRTGKLEPAQPRAQTDTDKRTAAADDSAKPQRKPKYRNQRVYIYEDGFTATAKTDGHGRIAEKFDSVKEYQRCLELRLMERAGKISELTTQATLMIQEKFKGQDGKTHRAITYRADFAYMENGTKVIEDVKAFDKKTQKFRTTETFNIKWKLLQAKYPDYNFRLF